MLRLDLLILFLFGNADRLLHGFLAAYRELLESHTNLILPLGRKTQSAGAYRSSTVCLLAAHCVSYLNAAGRQQSGFNVPYAPADFVASIVFGAASAPVISILRAFVSSRFLSVTVSIPLSNSALAPSTVTVCGSVKERENSP